MVEGDVLYLPPFFPHMVLTNPPERGGSKDITISANVWVGSEELGVSRELEEVLLPFTTVLPKEGDERSIGTMRDREQLLDAIILRLIASEAPEYDEDTKTPTFDAERARLLHLWFDRLELSFGTGEQSISFRSYQEFETFLYEGLEFEINQQFPSGRSQDIPPYVMDEVGERVVELVMKIKNRMVRRLLLLDFLELKLLLPPIKPSDGYSQSILSSIFSFFKQELMGF